MRRLKALLIVAGLAAAPAQAAAHPCPQSSDHSAHSEWTAGKGRLGVLVMSLTPELRKHFGAADDRGLIVAHVEQLSPASQAGLKPGDVITEVKGRTVSEASDVRDAIADVPRDQSVSIKLVRDGKPLELSVKLTNDAMSLLDPSMSWFHDFFKPFSNQAPTPPARA